ncbi:MAG: bifunctional 2',3'-cyclic-nucleotide 2'-phosphodiesterase/3'-nucleotidase [Pseudomonadota bacterium]
MAAKATQKIWQIERLGFMKVQDRGASAAEKRSAMGPAGRRGSEDMSARLRVLASSDVHAHLRSFDYAREVEVEEWGLTRLASCVKAARREATVSVLLDNGDLLQGTPLAQVHSELDRKGLHPVLRAMEAMGYDAIGLGNHEFNYGLDRLLHALDGTRIPVLCANVLTHKAEDVERDVTLRAPWVIIERDLIDPETQKTHPLRIGVLSVLPAQVMNWDGTHLQGRVDTRDMVEAARVYVGQVRDVGADIVILLAHSGIDPNGIQRGAENAAVALAQVPGIDALVTGHTHRVFPGGAWSGAGIDADAGTLHGVPAIMPGFRGSHLGIIDLDLVRRGDRWQVVGHAAEAVAVKGAPEDEALMQVVEPAHQATLDYIHQPLGQTARPLHSYLSQVRDDLPTHIVAMAQRAGIESRLAGTEHAHLPLLSASAPYQTGGRAGPMAYIDIPSGPLTMRDANSLYPFPNTLCAVRSTGGELRDWLERAASAFCQITPGQGDQPLLNPAFPGHAVDTIYGLNYRIDLTRPPAYDDKGSRLVPVGAPSRVVDLMHEGLPVQADDAFVVAVNGYRAFGGGPYAPIGADRILLQTGPCALKSVAEYLAAGGAGQVNDTPCWSFLPVANARGVFETGPGIAVHDGDIEDMGLCLGSMTADGFLTVMTPLDHRSCESAA